MERFIGREKELAALERLYEKDGFQMLVMYGRRRVGKSTRPPATAGELLGLPGKLVEDRQ